MTDVEVVGRRSLRLAFSDGRVGRIDLSNVVSGEGPMVEPLRDPAVFDSVHLVRGVPTWPNGFDVAPNWLYREMEASGALSPPLAA